MAATGLCMLSVQSLLFLLGLAMHKHLPLDVSPFCTSFVSCSGKRRSRKQLQFGECLSRYEVHVKSCMHAASSLCMNVHITDHVATACRQTEDTRMAHSSKFIFTMPCALLLPSALHVYATRLQHATILSVVPEIHSEVAVYVFFSPCSSRQYSHSSP